MPSLLPRTLSVHSFSYDIEFEGTKIGNLQTFQPSETRTLTRVRGLAEANVGETIEIVPSITDTTVNISAIELYSGPIMEKLGYDNFCTIANLLDPIDIIETINPPSGSNGSIIRVGYLGCHASNWSKSNIAANGNVVTDNVTFQVAKVRRLT